MSVAAFQQDRLPAGAIAIKDRLPPRHQEVLGWVSDEDVAIHYFPLVIWRDGANQWWGGLPGKYLNLGDLQWTVTHWKPIT